jgi:O-acetyl-ADP-ribose deacetylase (regulator of RNase III)
MSRRNAASPVKLPPYHEAPELMAHDRDGSHPCYFKRQPETPEEVEDAVMACVVSCVRAVRYDGTDPKILQRFREMKSEDSCDAFSSGKPSDSEGESSRKDQKINVRVVEGDLLAMDVEAVVNSWNRNIIPWWLLLPQGVSGAIKRRAGYRPFRELGRLGPIPLGGAVPTSAGRLPYRAIIHIAGINMLWRASEVSIRDSVRNAVAVAEQLGLRSLAFPIIGSGSGGFDPEKAEQIMRKTLDEMNSPVEVVLVRYRPSTGN